MLSIIQAAGWSIWPLIACSVLAVALVIERFVNLCAHKVTPPKLTDETITVSHTSVPPTVIVLQLEQNSVLGCVLARALRKPASQRAGLSHITFATQSANGKQ